MPKVPAPETLISNLERARKVADKIPDALRYNYTCVRPVEIRQIDPIDYFNVQVKEPNNQMWMRTIQPLPDNEVIHQCLLAYASDFGLLETSMRPHGVCIATPSMQVASLDHAMWFHQDFRFDEWLLYDVQSPRASNARGLNYGAFFNQRGDLVASTVQEGLMRQHGD